MSYKDDSTGLGTCLVDYLYNAIRNGQARLPKNKKILRSPLLTVAWIKNTRGTPARKWGSHTCKCSCLFWRRLGCWAHSTSGYLAMAGDFFSCHSVWGRWNWHLRGRGQRCCQTSYEAQDSPPQQRIIYPRMSRAPKLRDPALHHQGLFLHRCRNQNFLKTDKMRLDVGTNGSMSTGGEDCIKVLE